MSNVIPISGNGGAMPPSDQPPKQRKSQTNSRHAPAFRLTDPPDGPSTLRLLQALHGVCAAVEATAELDRTDIALDLGTAAAVLSDMVLERACNGSNT